MRFKGLDLNLLVALDALLAERSVSGAAERLHLSQPAMSAALGRLREHLDDPILLPLGRRMVPTAYAERLAAPVARLLAEIERLTTASGPFDPAESRRVFRICASDYITQVLLVPLVRELAQSAPGIGIEIIPQVEVPSVEIEKGEIDLLIAPEDYVSRQHPAEPLFRERHVVVGWRDNPAMAGPMTQERFYAQGHIVVAFGRSRTPAFAEQQMKFLGRERRVEVVAPTFSSVPALLVGTTRLAVMQRRLAAAAARLLPLATAPLPFDFPDLVETQQHHRTREGDEGLAWLRGTLRDLAGRS